MYIGGLGGKIRYSADQVGGFKDLNLSIIIHIQLQKIDIGLGYYLRKQHEVLSVYRPKKPKNTYWARKMRKGVPKVGWHGASKERSFGSVLSILKIKNGILGQQFQQHINQSPVKLWYPFLKWMCPQKGSVLDPCAGIGSVGIACKQMGRKYHGIEIDQEYVDVGNTRIKKASNQTLESFQTNNIREDRAEG